MQTFIDEYIEFENNPKYHRERSHLIAQLLARYPNIAQTSFGDLLNILERLKHSQATIRMPLFAQMIYPVLDREITTENAQAIRVMLQYTPLLHRYNHMHKIYNGYHEGALIRRYLQQVPDDREVLMKKKTLHDNSLYDALHELPYGVLYGNSGATLEECNELLAILEEYKNTCEQLQIDCEADIRYYTMHFQGYRDYLLHRSLYQNYLEYIQKHNLESRTTRNYYYA